MEQALIGALMHRPHFLAELKISMADFVDPRAKIAFFAILEKWKKQEPVDLVTIGQTMPKEISWLAKICGTPPSQLCTAEHYATQITEQARKRRIVAGAQIITQRAKMFEADDLLDDLINLYRTEIGTGDKDYAIMPVLSRFAARQQENRERGFYGLGTGFGFLDRHNLTFVPGHMWVIGALPGTGKTNTLIHFLANTDHRTLVFSTEMTEEQLVARYLANRTGVDAKVILSGGMLPKHHEQVEREKAVMAGKTLEIVDDVKDVSELERIVRLENMRGGVDVVFIDYIQHLRIYGKKSKYEQAAAISHVIQDLAKTCRCTIVCFSQVTLGSKKEYQGDPQYKGAGEFAEDCDVGARLMSNPEMPGYIQWATEKNRHGVRPVQMLAYRDGYTRLEEIAHEKNRPTER